MVLNSNWIYFAINKLLIIIYLRSGLIDSVSPMPGDMRCDWKNRLSFWPNELLIFGAEPLRWLNGSVTLNMFEWFVGLKLFNELPGIFTGADVPCKIPVQWQNGKLILINYYLSSEDNFRRMDQSIKKDSKHTRNWIWELWSRYIKWCRCTWQEAW